MPAFPHLLSLLSSRVANPSVFVNSRKLKNYDNLPAGSDFNLVTYFGIEEGGGITVPQ